MNALGRLAWRLAHRSAGLLPVSVRRWWADSKLDEGERRELQQARADWRASRAAIARAVQEMLREARRPPREPTPREDARQQGRAIFDLDPHGQPRGSDLRDAPPGVTPAHPSDAPGFRLTRIDDWT